jgi:hypothetical protein
VARTSSGAVCRRAVQQTATLKWKEEAEQARENRERAEADCLDAFVWAFPLAVVPPPSLEMSPSVTKAAASDGMHQMQPLNLVIREQGYVSRKPLRRGFPPPSPNIAERAQVKPQNHTGEPIGLPCPLVR